MYEELPQTGALVPITNDNRDIFSIARLNREARELLEATFPLIWVEGELSNLARPASGHWYFTLKDESAQIRCAMFRGRNSRVRFAPENGHHILVRGQLSLYEARGDYQLIIEHMEEAGEGALQRAFEALKAKLAAAGLFDPSHKQPLPTLPKQIGIVTSATGAALRDILSVLQRRFPLIPVIIYPTAVQGKGAELEIAAAIHNAARRHECDVLIIARGGGSLEDLWAFNEEVVARAIYDCPIPVVTGVGHEIDFTIADFVADVRAPTPSGAAEIVSPDQEEWQQTLHKRCQQLQQHLQRRLNHKQQQWSWLNKRLQQQHPGQQLRQRTQQLDELEQRLLRIWQQRQNYFMMKTKTLEARLQRHQPLHRIRMYLTRFEHHGRHLLRSIGGKITSRQQQLNMASQTLDAVSPLATLSRGYAIVQDGEGNLIRRARDVSSGQTLQARLSQGRIECTVVKAITE